MIDVDLTSADHVRIRVRAPLTVPDITTAGSALKAVEGTPRLRRALVEVESIGLPEPRVLWEDLRLAPLVGSFHRVALVTDLGWYAHLAELASAVSPRLTIKHFEAAEADAATAWLALDDGSTATTRTPQDPVDGAAPP